MRVSRLFVVTILFASACVAPSSGYVTDEQKEYRGAVESADAVMIGTIQRGGYYLGGERDYVSFRYREILKGPSVHWKTSLLFDRSSDCPPEYQPDTFLIVLTKMEGQNHVISDYCQLIVEATDDRVSQIRHWISGS